MASLHCRYNNIKQYDLQVRSKVPPALMQKGKAKQGPSASRPPAASLAGAGRALTGATAKTAPARTRAAAAATGGQQQQRVAVVPLAQPRGQVPDTPDSRGKVLQALHVAQHVAEQTAGAAAPAAQPRRLSLPSDGSEILSPHAAQLEAALPPGSAILNTGTRPRLPPPPFAVEEAAEQAGRRLRFGEPVLHGCSPLMDAAHAALPCRRAAGAFA